MYKLYIPKEYLKNYNDHLALIDNNSFYEKFDEEEIKLLNAKPKRRHARRVKTSKRSN